MKLPFAEGASLAGDFDGDGKTEFAFWSADKTGLSFKRSSDQQKLRLTINGEALLLGDYDGDGKSDCASRQANG